MPSPLRGSCCRRFPHLKQRANASCNKVTARTLTATCLIRVAQATQFGKPLVNSMFTLALLVGMSVLETTHGTTIANLGFEEALAQRVRSITCSCFNSYTTKETRACVNYSCSAKQQGIPPMVQLWPVAFWGREQNSTPKLVLV